MRMSLKICNNCSTSCITVSISALSSWCSFCISSSVSSDYKYYLKKKSCWMLPRYCLHSSDTCLSSLYWAGNEICNWKIYSSKYGIHHDEHRRVWKIIPLMIPLGSLSEKPYNFGMLCQKHNTPYRNSNYFEFRVDWVVLNQQLSTVGNAIS